MGAFLQYDAVGMLAEFDRKPFEFLHTLQRSPLFNLDLLGETAAALYPDGGDASVYCMRSADVVDQDFNDNIARSVDLAEIVRNIASNRSWVVIKRIERHPAFTELVRAVHADFAEHIPAFREGAAHQVHGYVFISSPGTITPYHIDAEWSLLAQVRGLKHYRIFDVTDPDVLSPVELEQFYCGNFDAAKYAPHKEETARQFHLRPGMALTQPRHAPHIVEVDSAEGYSITFGMSLLTKRWAIEKPIHTLNAKLRRAGLRPSPVGLRPHADLLKSAGSRAAAKALGIARLSKSA